MSKNPSMFHKFVLIHATNPAMNWDEVCGGIDHWALSIGPVTPHAIESLAKVLKEGDIENLLKYTKVVVADSDDLRSLSEAANTLFINITQGSVEEKLNECLM